MKDDITDLRFEDNDVKRVDPEGSFAFLVFCYGCGSTDYLWYLTNIDKISLYHAIRMSVVENNGKTNASGNNHTTPSCSASCLNKYLEENKTDVLIKYIEECYGMY
jgi:hypothetical protein